MKEKNHPRPPLESLACVNPDCDLYGKKDGNHLIVRKIYGRDKIRYLRCRCCQQEFSERKNTALWNSKIPEEKAVWVAEHLADGCSIKSTARLVKVDASTVRRLNQKTGKHGQQYHEQEVQDPMCDLFPTHIWAFIRKTHCLSHIWTNALRSSVQAFGLECQQKVADSCIWVSKHNQWSLS